MLTEETVRQVFGLESRIIADPTSGRPIDVAKLKLERQAQRKIEAEPRQPAADAAQK